MNRKHDLYLCLTCLLLALLFTMADVRKEDEALAFRIAPNILRFHVLANSDSAADQKLKLNVRTLLLDSIYEDLGEHASLEETKEYVSRHKKALEGEAETYMKEQGFNYPARVEVTNCYFPTKSYGDMIFPCGFYDAARVVIGEGKGSNWWCVLYPPLCFVDSTYAVIPDTSRDILKEALLPSDYRSLLKDNTIQIRPRLRFLDELNAAVSKHSGMVSPE